MYATLQFKDQKSKSVDNGTLKRQENDTCLCLTTVSAVT